MNPVSDIERFWLERSPRERTVLSVGAAVLLAAALYAFLWEPGMAARKKLSAALPVLRAQVESMRQQEKEISTLRKTISAAPQRGDLATVLRASAARAPIAKSVERIETISAGAAIVQAAAIEFDAWLEWIEALQRELGVRVDSCRIVPLEQPGRARIEATLQWPGAKTP